MEVGEENTSNHLQDSTTTASNEVLLENDRINDDKLGKEVLEPNTQEVKGEELPVKVPKLDDSKPNLTVQLGETATVEEVTVEGRNSQSIDVESKDNDGGNKDEIPKADVADADHGGSELTSAKIDGRECEAVIENNNQGAEGEAEATKMEEDVPSLPVAEIGESEEVKTDDKTDDVVETVPGDEAEQIVAEIDKEKPVVADENKSLDTDMETDEDKAETESPEQPVKTSGRRGRKRKRGGKTPQATPKSTVEEEDVCFICFDGGDLVLCDKRNCPKAYHPSCINRDEAFFQTKGRWNCGWHLCSVCSKKAAYMCYTCTFSLCKSCMKKNVLLCIREKEKKGFCDSCVETLMLIEESSPENQGNVDFNDKNSWEHLFKDYWTDMKSKLNISLSELIEARNAWKGSNPAGKQDLPAGHSDGDSASENPSQNPESQPTKTRKRKSNKPKTRSSAAGTSDKTQWASKELLEFVLHMGYDTSYQSQFDVQALLLEYIKTNKLRDSRKKSQIICDARLQGLFGKPRVGHFEMLKLLESHFLVKEDDDNQGSVVDTETGLVDDDKTKDKKRKLRKKSDQEPQSNRDDYAAIDIHNINLIYLKRKLAEDLLDDSESFRSKIVGTFVRIRIFGANQNQDLYRLVQVTGTTTSTQYAVGKKTTDIMLEILNLDKTESISIDTISNQDFTEDECNRLRQSIKCGLINRLRVGDILDKAIELQAARVNDWIETEVVRLSHLRDRASDLGRKKELRECVEKLEVLKTPEERARRIQDIPAIHDDPTMDPNYESEDDLKEDDKKQDMYKSSMDSRFNKRRNYPSKESWRGKGTSTSRNPGKSYAASGNNFSKNVEAVPVAAAISPRTILQNDNIRDQGKDRIVQPPSSVSNKPTSANVTESSTTEDVSETEKLWHYKDPTGTIQGLFSLAQLRKWHTNNFFPVDLKIWRTNENEKDGILLTDALEGRFSLKHGLANLPSPTPSSGHVGPTVGPSLYHEGLQPNGASLVQSGYSGGSLQNQQLNQVQFQNPNIGIVGPAPTMNWSTGNVNMPWGLQAGPGNVNPGWVGPQPVTPTQGYGSPRPRNGSEPYNRSRGGGSGFSGNTRHQGSFNNRGR